MRQIPPLTSAIATFINAFGKVFNGLAFNLNRKVRNLRWNGVSVVLPTIEEEGAFAVIDSIRALMPGCEIIVIDKSGPEYRKRIRAKKVKIVEQQSKGYENALMEGFSHAKGNVLATIDPDGTYDPEDLAKVVALVVEGDADMALGNRLHNRDRKAMNGYISFGNKNITKIYNAVHGIGIHDALSGIFAMKKEAFEAISEVVPYRAGTLFFVLEVSKAGYNKIKDIPISYYPRPSGESKLAKSKLLYGLGVAGHIVRSARDYSPLLIFGVIGVLLILAGLVIGAFVIANYLHTGTLNEIGRSLIAFMLVTVGFLSVISGLILDLLLQIVRKMDKL